MLIQILAGTPKWVFAVFALLLWLGARQWLPHRVSLRRAALMPAAMTVLSVYGVLSVFRHQPLALLGWAVAALAAGVVVLQRQAPASTRYLAAERCFEVGGSAVPLALMMGIFFTKYAVGVQVAMHPQLSSEPAFALAVGLLYGAFSGVFTGRGLRLWRLAADRDSAAVAQRATL